MNLPTKVVLLVIASTAFIVIAGHNSPSPPPEQQRSLKEASQKIVGGCEVPQNLLTFAASVKFKHLSCSGSLIAPQYAITTAHCTSAKDPDSNPIVGVKAGSHNVSASKFYPAEKIFIHPKYIDRKVAYDIAVVKLKNPIDDPSISFPTLASSRDFENTGRIGIVAGWGSTDYKKFTPSKWLKMAFNKFLPWKECSSRESVFCAAKIFNLPDGIFSGDSGGPSVILEGGREVLVGVNSHGYGPEPSTQMTGHTSIAFCSDFIKNSTAGTAKWT